MFQTKSHRMQSGFTLVELMVVITLIAIISITFLTFFKSAFFGYLNLQTDASSLTEIESQANRIANVLRSSTSVTTASNSEFVGYAYFYPSDSYVSLIRYFVQTSGGVSSVMATVTPMSANPPTGAPLTAQAHTYTVISNYYQTGSTNLFNYLGSTGSVLTQPITDLATVKAINVNLAAKSSNGTTNQVITVQVTLRNRKASL